jgi:hypothetical protein
MTSARLYCVLRLGCDNVCPTAPRRVLDSRVCGRITAGLDGPFAGLRASLASLWLFALLAVAAIAADRRDRVARFWVVPEPETVARQPYARRSVSSRLK